MIGIAQGGVYTIGVRLRVARFDDMGNAKALLSEASNKCWLHAFLFMPNRMKKHMKVLGMEPTSHNELIKCLKSYKAILIEYWVCTPILPRKMW